MRWFRVMTIFTVFVTLLMAVALAAVIISMCTNASHIKSMDSDPYYNGTLGIYIIITLIQFTIISCAFFGFCVAFRNWKNNYQMDHSQRRRFITWLALWGLFSLANLGVAIYAIVRGKEPQEEMAYLYEIFAKTNQDSKFVGHFEKYQRENSCCGVYGPDDWMMVQLRSGMGGGGGGGGFQSLDYGFRQNPSTGHCHLTPPTIPMGCGRKILEEIHIVLATFAGLMILETLVAIAACCMAGYCFFYWLEKEVIVIPEDEVSNMIIIEPESSTATTIASGGYLPAGSPYLGPPPDDFYPPPEYSFQGGGGSRSRGHSYVSTNGQRHSGNSGFPPSGRFGSNATYPILRADNGSGGGGGGSTGSGGGASVPPGSIPLANVSAKGTIVNPGSGSSAPPGSNPIVETATMAMLSAAGPFDANSRPSPARGGYGSRSREASIHQASYMYRAPTQQQPFYGATTGSRSRSRAQALRAGSMIAEKPHSANHMLHKQEKALGGKLLGEIHVDHKKDDDPMSDKTDAAKGKKGHKTHHATIAIVRNKNAPKPKKMLADDFGNSGGHHGQTGHLAEDIAEMSGNPEVIREVLDDVILPVEHAGGSAVAQGGYLKTIKRNHPANLATATGSQSVGGVEAQNIISNFLDPVALAHAHGRSLEEEERPIIQPHLAGASKDDHHHHPGGPGSHENAHYLNTGSHQNAHYINPGSHENAHYINPGSHQNAHYINPGSHENAHYINAGSHQNAHYLNTGSHENAHYLNTGSHHTGSHHNAHRGSHENAHYINRGSHENAHYINRGSHEHPHRGSHENAHYINRGSHEHPRRGSHENAHYINAEAHEHPHRGSHEHAHYINAGVHDHPHRGSHEHAHYINAGVHDHPHRGSHEHAHYINAGTHDHPHRGSHEHAHYINRGSHENAHYINRGLHEKSLGRMGAHHHLHKSGYEEERKHSGSKGNNFNRWPVKTELLYKNPKALEDSD